ncbi:MAG TPA: agmatine deiminase family protein [Candidatus Binatia bacterium]|nr:agmatine deiminase family protein [Candidatus Binatia bacterium]
MALVATRPTPASLGYAMPAEWQPHRATWLAWPHNRETWPTQLNEVQETWVKMVQTLSLGERVYLLVNDESTRQHVSSRLERGGAAMEQVSVVIIPTVDVWMRDYGPTFITRPGPDEPLALNDWIFNGWGGKYPSYESDDRIAKEIASLLRVPVFDHPIVLEGGSIDVNGLGTCLTTEQCLLHKNRNSHLSRSEIERFLQAALGVTRVIWLGEGIVGDDTDGHIDDIARFVNANTIVSVVEANSKDPNYRPLQENQDRLKAARDQNGAAFTVVPLPCPHPVYHQDARLPASYANFYIGNEMVLVPTFEDLHDEQALGILQDLFVDRKVIGLSSTALVAGLGAVHCVTQQEPRIFSGA